MTSSYSLSGAALEQVVGNATVVQLSTEIRATCDRVSEICARVLAPDTEPGGNPQTDSAAERSASSGIVPGHASFAKVEDGQRDRGSNPRGSTANTHGARSLSDQSSSKPGPVGGGAISRRSNRRPRCRACQPSYVIAGRCASCGRGMR